MSKLKTPDRLRLNENLFCRTIDRNAVDVSCKYHVNTSSDYYNLMYRDGQFMGIPSFFGGKLYPFSKDPTKKGSWLQKRKFTEAQIVCLSYKFDLIIDWGTRTPFTMADVQTGEPYSVGATGAFYVEIDSKDAARSANLLYQSCIKQRSDSDDDGIRDYSNEDFRDFLRKAFINRVGAKMQEYLEAKKLPLSNLVGLQPREFLQISEDLYPMMKDMFADYGLIVTKASRSSLLQGIVVNPK